jgi:ribosome-binding protein aMBF1 (putative translation factor)
LTPYEGFPILGDVSEVNELPGVVDYDETMAPYRAQLTPEDRARSDVFRQAYSLAMQVIELREQHGLTQAQLAERCGMDQADISRIERGAVSPTARTLQRVADALDADLRLVARAS